MPVRPMTRTEADRPCDDCVRCERCELCAAFRGAVAVVRMPFAAGEEIFRQGDPADHVYRIQSGAVVTYRLLSDGRRQVTDFHVAGDFIGLEAGVEYSVTAEALGAVTAVAVRRGALSELAETNAALGRTLWQLSVRAWARSQDHALILGRHGACERVAAFLLAYADRVGADGCVDLPMTRQDMADHLGLTIHTVSRTLSQLEAEGLIEARTSRHVRLVRRDRLERLRA